MSYQVWINDGALLSSSVGMDSYINTMRYISDCL